MSSSPHCSPHDEASTASVDAADLPKHHLAEAFTIIVEIMRDRTVHAATRLRAATTMVERALGRVRSAAQQAVLAQPLHPGPFVGAPKISEEEWNRRFGKQASPAPSAP